MKKFILTLILGVAGFLSTFAMSFSEAQEHAYFLTDKMAYELDLTPAQYDHVYQVNLEYLLNVRTSNPFDYYWEYRNVDLSYILYDWQYNRYRMTEYFYRPIVRRHSAWYFPLWDHYHRTYFFFGRPSIWSTWRGGIWRNRTAHTHSPFVGQRPPQHNGGMRHDLHPGQHHGGQPGGKPGHNGGNHGGQPGYNGNGHNGNGHSGQGAQPGGNRPGGNGHSGQGAQPGGNRPSGGGNGNQGAQPGGSRPGGNGHGGSNAGAGSRGGGNAGAASRGGASRSGSGSRSTTPSNGTRSFGGR